MLTATLSVSPAKLLAQKPKQTVKSKTDQSRNTIAKVKEGPQNV